MKNPGFLGRDISPEQLAFWLTEDDVADYIDTYSHTCFRSGLN
jgi:hypothetical protein